MPEGRKIASAVCSRNIDFARRREDQHEPQPRAPEFLTCATCNFARVSFFYDADRVHLGESDGIVHGPIHCNPHQFVVIKRAACIKHTGVPLRTQ